jgi:hypothetical protein
MALDLEKYIIEPCRKTLEDIHNPHQIQWKDSLTGENGKSTGFSTNGEARQVADEFAEAFPTLDVQVVKVS